MTILYVKVGDDYLPNFELSPPDGDIGFYKRLRRKHLIEQHSVLMNQLVFSGKLFEHLAFTNQQATKRRELLFQQVKEKLDVTEELKALLLHWEKQGFAIDNANKKPALTSSRANGC